SARSATRHGLVPEPQRRIRLRTALAVALATPVALPDSGLRSRPPVSPYQRHTGLHRVFHQPNRSRSRLESALLVLSLPFSFLLTARQKHAATLIAESSKDNI